MNNELALVKSEENGLMNYQGDTGLVVTKTFEANSGFEYSYGLREFGDLTIVEEVGRGTAVSYLNNVRVYNKDKDLVVDKSVKKGTHYSREIVRQIVLRELLKMLEEAALNAGKEFDFGKANAVIDEKLKQAYFEKSYKSILSWAETIGIEFI